jgi:hypothetical protein
MTRNSLSRVTAGVAVAATLAVATPAMSTEMNISSAFKKSATAPVRHHGSRYHAALHRHHQVDRLASRLGCSGEWCGRQFVLMVGVGF